MPRAKQALLYAFCLVLAAGPLRSADADAPAAAVKPNFIIIFCDDLGYGDVGCFGSTKHRTPNIDRIAAEGMRLTSFYVTSGVCTPSRSSLMTGCYPRRVNMHVDGKGGWVLFPAGIRGLHPDEITIAEILKQQGYATAIVGKWHLGDQPQFLPTKQGFDSYFGIPYSNDMGQWNKNRNYPPLPLLQDETVIETEPDQSQLTRRYTEKAVQFIAANKEQPFFLYLPHTMPHNPVHASEQFAGKSANGGYGDAVEEIDWSTGKILEALKKHDIDDRTLVVFTSDNGAAARWGGSNAPLRGFKGSTMEGGMRIPCVVRWPGKIPQGRTCDEVAATLDIMPTFAKLAGGAAPQDRVIDGRDIWPLLAGDPQAKSPHEAFYYYYRERLQAVRSGKWKLHLPQTAGRQNANAKAKRIPQRLFDLDADINEAVNAAAEHPQVVARLLALAEIARDDIGDGKRAGKNQRPAGFVESPRPLAKVE